MPYRTIDVAWHGPFRVMFDAKSGGHSVPDLPAKLGNRHGVYAIYGQHPVYGSNALLYIGQTSQRVGGTGPTARLGSDTVLLSEATTAPSHAPRCP